MTGHEPHAEDHAAAEAMTAAEMQAAEKSVADAIEAAIDVPASIEEQQMLEAAEIEELEAGS